MSAKRAQEPRVRRPMSAEKRAKLSATQKAYIASDPRWPAHRQKLVDMAKRRTLLPHEIAAFQAMQRQGWTFKHIARQIRINDGVLRRELRAKGVATAPGNGRMTLLPGEITAILAMRKKGRTFSYIAEEIGIHDRVLRREFRANDFQRPASDRIAVRSPKGGLDIICRAQLYTSILACPRRAHKGQRRSLHSRG